MAETARTTAMKVLKRHASNVYAVQMMSIDSRKRALLTLDNGVASELEMRPWVITTSPLSRGARLPSWVTHPATIALAICRHFLALDRESGR